MLNCLRICPNIQEQLAFDIDDHMKYESYYLNEQRNYPDGTGLIKDFDAVFRRDGQSEYQTKVSGMLFTFKKTSDDKVELTAKNTKIDHVIRYQVLNSNLYVVVPPSAKSPRFKRVVQIKPTATNVYIGKIFEIESESLLWANTKTKDIWYAVGSSLFLNGQKLFTKPGNAGYNKPMQLLTRNDHTVAIYQHHLLLVNKANHCNLVPMANAYKIYAQATKSQLLMAKVMGTDFYITLSRPDNFAWMDKKFYYCFLIDGTKNTSLLKVFLKGAKGDASVVLLRRSDGCFIMWNSAPSNHLTTSSILVHQD